MTQKDYYKILGVERTASKDDIKKAFRTLAHRYHPDKTGGDESRFKEIGEAYSILSDERKRAEYDAYGTTFGGAQGPGGFDFGGFDFSQFTRGGFGQQMHGAEFDLGDLFGDFFGGGAPRKGRRGRDISIDIEVPFKESVFGIERRVLLTKVGTCPTCRGNGAQGNSELVTCATCNGTGNVHEAKRTVFGTFSTARVCDACHGHGKVPKERCKACGGVGVTRREEEMTIAVPAGIEDGEMIRLTGGGEATPGGTSGDLYVKVHVKADTRYRKEGADVVMPLSIKLTEALLGATRTVETLDGEVSVKVPAGVTFGERLRLKGKGVPQRRGNTRGDLYIEVHIKLPTKLSKRAREAIATLMDEGV